MQPDALITPKKVQIDTGYTDSRRSVDTKGKIDRTKDNDRFVTILKGWIDQFALSMTNSDTKNYIQQLLIEPFMEYIFQRAFPYAIIAICVVLGIFIIVIVIFILLILNRNKCSMCDRILS